MVEAKSILHTYDSKENYDETANGDIGCFIWLMVRYYFSLNQVEIAVLSILSNNKIQGFEILCGKIFLFY